jgi:peptide chain release factor subunit 3
VLHVHTAAEECSVAKIVHSFHPKTGKPVKEKFLKSFKGGKVLIQLEQSLCMEKFEEIPQMGRFTLRDEERTIAIGMVTGLPKPTGAK